MKMKSWQKRDTESTVKVARKPTKLWNSDSCSNSSSTHSQIPNSVLQRGEEREGGGWEELLPADVAVACVCVCEWERGRVGTRAYTHTLSLTHTFTARACGLKHPARVWVGAWECVADAAHPLAACAGARACVCGGEREREGSHCHGHGQIT